LAWSLDWAPAPAGATGTPADFLTGVERSREFSRCMFRSTSDLQTVPAELVGHRWYQQRGIQHAYPFGHGLGYTSFDFDDLRAEVTEAGISLAFSVRNVGSRSGKAVPQIYITYPADAGEPPAQLKAFKVLRLEAGEARQVMIDIPLDDLAVFDELSQRRVVPPGAYDIHLGVSSAELPLKAGLQIG
jgi:beta-glucosidase